MSTLKRAEEDFLFSDIKAQFWKVEKINNVHYLSKRWIVSDEICNTVDHTLKNTAQILQFKK